MAMSTLVSDYVQISDFFYTFHSLSDLLNELIVIAVNDYSSGFSAITKSTKLEGTIDSISIDLVSTFINLS